MSAKFLWSYIGTLLMTGPLTSFSYSIQSDTSRVHITGDYNIDTARVNALNKIANESFSYDVRKLHTASRQAAQLARTVNYKEGEAIAYQNMALSYMLIHGDVVALDYLNKALRLFEQQQDTIHLSGVVNYMGCYYATVKDYSQALPFFLKSERLIGTRKHRLQLTILSNTGSCYEDLGQYDKAASYYGKVRILAEQIKDYQWIVTSLYQQASLHFVRNQHDSALALIKKALAVEEVHAIPPRDIQALHLLMGNVYFRQKAFQRAREHYEQAAELAKKMNSREVMSEVYNKLYSLDSVAGDYKSALENYRNHKAISDSLINDRKNQLSSLFKIRFDLSEEEAENNRLLLAREGQENVIFYQRIILAIAALLVAVAGYAIYRLRKVNGKLRFLNDQIVSQNEELTKVNAIKNRLFSVIAHDLRSPFGQFISLLDMVEAHMLDPQEIASMMPYLNQSASQTMSMMDNLLAWSRSQMNGFRVHCSAVALRDLINGTLDKVQADLINKNILTEVLVDADRHVWADEEMLRIVIRNLLTNAIKFTPTGGCIVFSATSNHGDVVLAIQDSGVGIENSSLSKLFSLETVSTRGTEQESGTGIGLKICKDLVELNHGEIWVESARGMGSTFYVGLPAKEGRSFKRNISVSAGS
ncbi:MAG TPA: ATP-binding protein [Dyadobacter sp.]|nr:ATP-binding protein [Dyadobacter sp.]